MTHPDFNRNFHSYFPRTQPREWREQPFEDTRVQWRLWFKVFGIIFLWIALFALSLWSIAQQGVGT